MADFYQYRITVNGQAGPITEASPGQQWAFAAQEASERGYTALLERRLVTDLSILDFFAGELPPGWLRLGQRVICAWEYMAGISREQRPEHYFVGDGAA